jgi:hypothetical protein
VTNILPSASNVKPVGRYKSANFINEKPGGTSAPFNSMVDAGIVGVETGVSVDRVCGDGVSTGNDVNETVGDCRVTVLVAG